MSRQLKKILIVSLRGPTNQARRGGAQDYIRFIGRELVIKQYDVSILCGQEIFGSSCLPTDEIVDGVSVERVGTPTKRFSSLFTALKDRANNYDLVIENLMGFPLFSPLSVRLFGWRAPLYAIKHHYEGINFINSQGLLKGSFGLFLEYLIQPLVYRSVQMIGVSDVTAKTIQNSWLKPVLPVEVIPPGIDAFASAQQFPKNKLPTILYFGALDVGRKRVDHLIDAFKSIAKDFPSAQLIIAGQGPSLEVLTARARGLNVSFEGFISEDRKHELLCESWFFASPSNSEGFGITWVEANAYGLPVVGYDLGLDTVSDQCSIMVEENNIEALADAMRQLCEDTNLREEMGTAARLNAQRFSWQSSAEKFLGLISNV